MKTSKAIISLTVGILMTGCGSLTPALESGQGFYSNLSKPVVIQMVESGKTKASKLETSASGCFAIAPESVDKNIIDPAVRKAMNESHSLAAANVKALRSMTPTILDAVTGAFIWGCSYWNVTGDLLQNNEIITQSTQPMINAIPVRIAP
jgi:hypothetical protein